MISKKRFAVVFALALCVSLAGEGKTQELRKEGKYWIGEIHKTFKAAKGGSLVMEDIRGDVTIQVWEKDEVTIHEIKKMDIFTQSEAEAAMKESATGYIQQGNTIQVGGPAFDRKWIQSTFDIYVPVEFNCNIETQGGDLSITGLKGNAEASTGGGDITLSTIHGIVHVKSGGGDIHIDKTTNEVTAKTGGGDVEVMDSQGPIRVSTGGGDVTITNTKDLVDVSTGGGDIQIKETQGGINVKTGGGEIEIENANGNVSVKTGGGEINIRNIKGNFQALTGGGSIQARTVMGILSVKTGGGEVELSDIQGSINVSTGGGDISAEVTLKDFSIDHRVDIQTGGGDIDLTLPEKIPATIQAEIKYNRRSWEEYEITSDFPLQITTKEEDSRYRIIRAAGDINGGGDLIKMKTGGGNIRIRKLRQ